MQGIADWLATTHNVSVTRERVRQVLDRLLTAEDRQKLAAFNAPKACKVCGDKGPTSLGYCRLHYQRHKRGLADDSAEMNSPIDVNRHEDGICALCGKVTEPGKRTKGMHSHPCYIRWRYHNLPGEKDRVRKNAKSWLERKLARQPSYAKKLKRLHAAAAKKYNDKRKAARKAASVDKQQSVKSALSKKATGN